MAVATNNQTGFPFAPSGWSPEMARETAVGEGMRLGEDHLEELGALQEYYAHHDRKISVRGLHDALDERFHDKGGLKFLYGLFPGGPVAQGCRLAGLEAPAGAVDLGFGSVV